MNRRALLPLLTWASLVAAAPAFASDWANWRGPNYNGSTDEKNLPVKFSPTENVKWVAPLPGPSAGTPIIYRDMVFVSSINYAEEQLSAICLDRKTGKQIWKHNVSSGYRPGNEGNKFQLDVRSNYASPSPVTDGKRVIFFYGNGDMVGFDLKGKKLWARNLQKEGGDFAFQWTFSSSPQLFEGKLYLQVLQRNQPVGTRGSSGNPSFLVCMDPDTGKESWRHVRPSTARMESLEAYSTPIPYVANGRKELLISGGDFLTGHDPETGKELWRWGTWNTEHREAMWRLVPSPVAGDGVVLACAPKTAPVFAAKLGGSGVLGESGLAWKSELRSVVTSDVPTPAFANGRFYVLSDLKKSISALNATTGEVIWTQPLAGKSPCWASPTVADGKIYALSLTGDIYVIDCANGSLLATNSLATDNDQDIRASIAVSGGCLFVRMHNKLFCIGK